MRAVFLDRDGTIIEEVSYISRAEDVVLVPGAERAMRLLRRMGFLLIGVSNQSGIGRGYFEERAVREVNERMEELLGEGAGLDDFLFCPHRPEDDCPCRKPRPGMLLEAAERYGIDLATSYLIGDHSKDIGAIRAVGGKGILVLTGYGKECRGEVLDEASFVAHDILEGAYWIMVQELKEGKMAISKELLEILACPKCKGDVHLTEKGDGLVCEACGLLYPIKDDIPIMLIEEALPYRKEREDG